MTNGISINDGVLVVVGDHYLSLTLLYLLILSVTYRGRLNGHGQQKLPKIGMKRETVNEPTELSRPLPPTIRELLQVRLMHLLVLIRTFLIT